MEINKLQQLLSEMSLQEKIGQMVQLTGVYFDKEAVLTGVVDEQLPPEWCRAAYRNTPHKCS